MSNVFVDRTGEVYGRWTIKSYSHSTSAGRFWNCVCGCKYATERAVFWGALQTGASKSCGICVKEEMGLFTKTHDRSKTLLYGVWKTIKDRCHNPDSKSYKDYGGRGIQMHQEWRDSFESFAACVDALGGRPSPKHSIDRTDVNGNYEPGNIRWADYKGQGRNRRDNHVITFNGETKTMIEWAESTGIGYSALRNRLNVYGWSEEKALTTPANEAPPPTEGPSKRVFIDHTGEQHGDWTILEYSHFAENNGRAWLCRCACGKEKTVYYSQLKSGKSKCCGSCSARKRNAARVQAA